MIHTNFILTVVSGQVVEVVVDNLSLRGMRFKDFWQSWKFSVRHASIVSAKSRMWINSRDHVGILISDRSNILPYLQYNIINPIKAPRSAVHFRMYML